MYEAEIFGNQSPKAMYLIPVRGAHSLVSIGRHPEAPLIIRAQAHRRFNRRDMRKKLIHTFRQERPDQEVKDQRF